MPCQFKWEERGVYQQLFGFVTANEYEISIQSLHSDARFYEAHYAIVDCLDVTGADFTDQNLSEIAILGHVAHLSNKRCPIAFIIVSEHLQNLIQNNIVNTLHGLINICITHSIEEARKWADELPLFFVSSTKLDTRP